MVNPTTEAVSFRLTLRGPVPNSQFEQPDAVLIDPADFSLPPGGMLTGTVSELFHQALIVTSGDVRIEMLQGEDLVGASLVEFPSTLMAATGDPALPAGNGYAPSIMTGSSGSLEVFTNLKMINRGNVRHTGMLTTTGQAGALLGKSAGFGISPRRSLEDDLGDLLEVQDTEDHIEGASLTVDFASGTGPANVIAGAQRLNDETEGE